MRCVTPFLRALSSTTTSLWSLYHPFGVLVRWCFFSHVYRMVSWSCWDWQTSSCKVAKFKMFVNRWFGRAVTSELSSVPWS